MKRNRWLIVVLSMLVAWLCDIFFYADPPGISFVLWVMALLAGGFLLAWLYGERWSRWSWMWAGFALLCALTTILRAEQVTLFCGYGLALGALAFLAGTFRTGNWINYRLREVFGMFLRLMGAAFFGLPRLFRAEVAGVNE